MSFLRLYVHEEVERYPKPIAELTFAAAFDPEHGVGVLTDGKKILGTGYSGDAEQFKKPRRRRTRS